MPVIKVGRDELRHRHDMYLANHYTSLHVTIVSITLGVAGLAAAGLVVPSSRFHGYQPIFWILWLASFMAIAAAYAGTMVGAGMLPGQIPGVIDLVLPLLLSVAEFALFAVLSHQVTGATSSRAVLTAWWFAFGGFGLLASASIWRAQLLISKAGYETDVAPAVARYLARQRRDCVSAAGLGGAGVIVGGVYALHGILPIGADYALAVGAVGSLGSALFDHAKTARELRRGLSCYPS